MHIYKGLKSALSTWLIWIPFQFFGINNSPISIRILKGFGPHQKLSTYIILSFM